MSAESGTVRITVTCTGRLPTTVRTIELRDYVVITNQTSSNTVLSRWAIAAAPTDRPLPADLAPTAYLEAAVEVQKVLEASSGLRDVTVRALVERGDGKWYASSPFRVR